MLFLEVLPLEGSETTAPLTLSGKSASEVLPAFKEALEAVGLKKPKGEVSKHDLDMILAGEQCERHLSSFQKRLKEQVKVRRIPHRTYKGEVMLLSEASQRG